MERAETVRSHGTSVMVDGSAQRWFAPGFMERDPELGGRLLQSLREVDRSSYAFCCETLAAFDVRAQPPSPIAHSSIPAFATQNSLLVITWDDGSGTSNSVTTIFFGPAARQAYESPLAYNHSSLLHTIESPWGLAPLTENDRDAPIMSDMLK